MDLELDTPLENIPFIGSRTAKSLKNKGLHTLGDLINFFPRKHLDRSKISKIAAAALHETVTCVGTVRSIDVRKRVT